MFVLLVGPKGSGKSHIGRVLERRLGVHFFHVEPHWMRYYTACMAAGRDPSIVEGIEEVHPRIAQALRLHEHVCVETTGASPDILAGLRSLASAEQTLVVRVSAPLEVCLERIASRDSANQIPTDADTCRKVYEISSRIDLPADVHLYNVELGDAAIAARFEPVLSASGA